MCVWACVRWGVGGGSVGLLYRICHVICSIFTLTSLFASFFHLPLPPLKSPTNWKKIPPYDASPMLPRPRPHYFTGKAKQFVSYLIGLALGLDGSVGNSRGKKQKVWSIHPSTLKSMGPFRRNDTTLTVLDRIFTTGAPHTGSSAHHQRPKYREDSSQEHGVKLLNTEIGAGEFLLSYISIS